MNKSLAEAYRVAAREERSRKPPKVSYPPWVVVPPELTEVVEGLFMGKRPRSYVGFDLVVSCEQVPFTGPLGGDGLLLWCPFADKEEEPPVRVSLAAGVVVEAVRGGKRTLVHCSLGLNRSALVVALALQSLEGLRPAESLARLRELHGPSVLSNRSFERWLVGDG